MTSRVSNGNVVVLFVGLMSHLRNLVEQVGSPDVEPSDLFS